MSNENEELNPPVPAGETPAAPAGENPPAPETNANPDAPIAAGGEGAPPVLPNSYWPEDWRDKVAEHTSAGNDKEREAVMKDLERVDDPANMWSRYREMQRTLGSGKLTKIPDGEAPEDIVEFYKAMGAPTEVAGYYDHIKLENGAEIGEADKPAMDAFIESLHGSTTPQEFVNKAINHYYGMREAEAAQQDRADFEYKQESMQYLKEQYGDAFERNTNSIATLFANAPGGSDLSNEDSFIRNFLGGRLADGTVIGNNPVAIQWLVSHAQELNPAATVTGDIGANVQTIDSELAEIDKLRRTDKLAYFKDKKIQQRELELLAAQEKLQARA